MIERWKNYKKNVKTILSVLMSFRLFILLLTFPDSKKKLPNLCGNFLANFEGFIKVLKLKNDKTNNN